MNPVLPGCIDNTYRGHPAAVWLFVPVVVVKTGIALGTIFNGRAAAQSADDQRHSLASRDPLGASGRPR